MMRAIRGSERGGYPVDAVFKRKGNTLNGFKDLRAEHWSSQGQNLAINGLVLPYLRDSGHQLQLRLKLTRWLCGTNLSPFDEKASELRCFRVKYDSGCTSDAARTTPSSRSPKSDLSLLPRGSHAPDLPPDPKLISHNFCRTEDVGAWTTLIRRKQSGVPHTMLHENWDSCVSHTPDLPPNSKLFSANNPDQRFQAGCARCIDLFPSCGGASLGARRSLPPPPSSLSLSLSLLLSLSLTHTQTQTHQRRCNRISVRQSGVFHRPIIVLVMARVRHDGDSSLINSVISDNFTLNIWPG